MYDVAKRNLVFAVATGTLLISGASPALAAVHHGPAGKGTRTATGAPSRQQSKAATAVHRQGRQQTTVGAHEPCGSCGHPAPPPQTWMPPEPPPLNHCDDDMCMVCDDDCDHHVTPPPPVWTPPPPPAHHCEHHMCMVCDDDCDDDCDHHVTPPPPVWTPPPPPPVHHCDHDACRH